MSYNNYRLRNYSGNGGYNEYRYKNQKYNLGQDDFGHRETHRSNGNGMLGLNKSMHYQFNENRYIPPSSGISSEEPSPTESIMSSTSRNNNNTANSSPASAHYHHTNKSSTPIPNTQNNSTSLKFSSSSSSLHTNKSVNKKKQVPGTDPKTGVNPADNKLPQLLHHFDLQKKVPFSTTASSKKNYKVLYDPETDKSLSKTERKSKAKKIRFNGEGVSSDKVADPRISGLKASQYFLKPNKKSKKFPYKQLPQPKFIYDKDSLGEPPRTDLVVWGLPITTSEIYMVNFFESYGDPIKSIKFINDPDNAVPLGIATFTFSGSPDKAMRSALKLLKNLQAAHPKIDGVDLKIALNDNDSKLLNTRIEITREKLRVEKVKRDEEERKNSKIRMELDEANRKEIQKAKDKEKEREAAKEIQAPKLSSIGTEANTALRKDQANSKYKPNTTMVSVRHKNKVIPGVFLPKDLNKYIKDRPYILIHDKYVPTHKISSQDVKNVLNKYDWTRVLSDKTGFYIVFNSLKECERCFFNEDGRKFFEYRLYMELAIPENFDVDKHLESSNDYDSNIIKKHNVVDEAVNMLIKEFQLFLGKDIRERVIAPYVLDLLNPERYPSIVQELKEKEATKPSVSALEKSVQMRQDAISLLAAKRKEHQNHLQEQKQQRTILPSFTKRAGLSHLSANKKRKNLVPMQHALNYDLESDASEDEESSRSATPVPTSLKREHETDLPKGVDDEGQLESKRKKTKLTQSFLYDSTDDEEMDTTPAPEVILKEDLKKEDTSEENNDDDDNNFDNSNIKDIDYSNVEEIFQPTSHFPVPVYEEEPYTVSEPFDLDRFRSIIKDSEDLKLATKLFENINPASDLNRIEYWAWKQKDAKSSVVTEEAADDGLESAGPLSNRLECQTGSFKSDGYRKIAESDKIEYLPHRRKVHKPLKTIQHDDDDNGSGNYNSNTNNNSIQSSRVNRANNRRFAADISAQKQMLGSETDILNLNALTKRKKPVSFARSAIHNWGLYALEPIAAKEMIIEYVGESIRQQVAEHREKSYLKTGIGSSYLFRIDENTVVDATKKGGIARFINHCCSPSCTAKIIKVEGKKRIVIYALRDIDANEELTYDYKFERETNDDERIKCLCGAPGCNGYLN